MIDGPVLKSDLLHILQAIKKPLAGRFRRESMPTGQAFAFLGGVVYGCAAADAALGWCEWLCRLGGAHAGFQKKKPTAVVGWCVRVDRPWLLL